MFNDDYTIRRPADFDYDAALSKFSEDIRRKAKVQKLIAYFQEEESRLSFTVEDRKKDYDAEQADVDELRDSALTLLLYTLMGTKAEKLSKEEAEALAAKAVYEAAVSELEHTRGRLSELRAELRALGNCERYYEEMLAEKKAYLLAKEAAVNTAVEDLEAEKAAIIRDSKELKEAMESGQYALMIARSIMDALHSAQLLSIEDTMPSGRGGRSIGSGVRDDEIDVKKRNALVRLNNSIQSLDKYLRDFAAELKDVSNMPMEYQLPTTRFGNGLVFIDRWVDDLISEIVVDVKLHGIEKQMEPLLEQLTPLVEGLEAEYAARETACGEIEEKIRALIIEA